MRFKPFIAAALIVSAVTSVAAADDAARRATFGPDDDLHAIGQREPGDRLHSGVRCLVGTGQQGLGLGL